MGANGQMDFIDDQPWFQDGTGGSGDRRQLLPQRPLVAGGLGLHKDTANENLFVNLIFSNTSDTPATEWTEDTELPDDVRMATLLRLLPPALAGQLMEAKQIIDRSDIVFSQTFRGGTPGPLRVRSVRRRARLALQSVGRAPAGLRRQAGAVELRSPTHVGRDSYSVMVVLAQTPGNDLFKTFGRIRGTSRSRHGSSITQRCRNLPRPSAT